MEMIQQLPVQKRKCLNIIYPYCSNSIILLFRSLAIEFESSISVRNFPSKESLCRICPSSCCQNNNRNKNHLGEYSSWIFLPVYSSLFLSPSYPRLLSVFLHFLPKMPSTLCNFLRLQIIFLANPWQQMIFWADWSFLAVMQFAIL